MKIGVLGLGWLGWPLAKVLLRDGHKIIGSTRTQTKLQALQSEGISASKIILEEDGPIGNLTSFLEESEVLIINIPPGLRRNPKANFVAKIQHLIPYIEKSDVQYVLFISSTSVFEDQPGFHLISDETIPNATSNAGKQLIKVEQLLLNNANFKTTILRFAGLFGPNRHPARMLSRRTNIKNPNAPVNLIHLDDCIGIIKKIIKTENWDKIFNASYPDHTEKSVYYSNICKQMGLPRPDYDSTSDSKGKIIQSSAIQEQLAYIFKRGLEIK